ncbi:MAG: hypothetical protein JSU98_13785 [Gemmatimonadales bacterium]|jgi:hypothetical protein|nr:MAG: hypothetical protein JSU98_13785 [Gemmatimonadales bacterium]
MLTLEHLTRLHRDLRDKLVLSVYLDTDQHDPAQRVAWKTRFDRALAGIRRDLESKGQDLTPFLAAKDLLEQELDRDGFLEGKGWVAFGGAAGVHVAGPVPFHVPDQVSWDTGVHLAPYLRGLRHLRPVVVVVADRRHARFLEFREGILTEKPGLVAFGDVGDVADSGVAKRAARNSGVRGATAKDLANRFLEVEADRLHHAVVDRVQEAVGKEGLVLFGGPGETASRLLGMLERSLQERARIVPGLSMEDDTNRMTQAVGDAASELSRTLQERMLDEVLDQALANGRGRVGTRDARKALRENRADLLLVSATLVENHTELAEQLVGAALDQSSDVELLVGPAAVRLDEVGEGLAVRLRY